MRSSESPCKTNAGFTFLDLMITVAITGILTAIAIPSYWNYVIDTRLAGDAQFLAESLHLARIEAVTRDVPGQPVPEHKRRQLYQLGLGGRLDHFFRRGYAGHGGWYRRDPACQGQLRGDYDHHRR